VATIHFVRVSPNTLRKSDQVITIYASTICASPIFASFKCMTLKRKKNSWAECAMKNNNANYTRILIDIWKQDEDKNCNEGTFFFWVWDVPPNLRDKCRHLNSTQHTKWIQLINTCTWNLEFCNYKMVIGLAYPNTKFPLSSLHIHTWWRHTSQELVYLSNG